MLLNNPLHKVKHITTGKWRKSIDMIHCKG